MSKRGTDSSDQQSRNILFVDRHCEVLNAGTVIRELHPLNMLSISVTFVVSKSGTVRSLQHPENIFFISVEEAVSNIGIEIRE